MEEILHRAERLEKEYDWVGAAESYEKTLNLLPADDFSRKSEIHERLGYALYRTAFQAESSSDFRARMRQAVETYEKAKELYEKMGEPEKATAVRLAALIAYSSSWLTQEPSEKKKLLDESWRLTKKCLTVFDKAENPWEYGRTYNRLLASALYGFLLEWNYDARLMRMKEALDHGERAISLLSASGDPELVKAYVGAGVCKAAYNYYFVEHAEKEEGYKKTRAYWEKARELSKETAAFELLSDLALTGVEMGEEGSDEALKNFEEAVGSERFEHADIQANLIVRQKELKIGENLNIELELVNAGKGSALLTKVTEIIPKGFELAEKSDNCRVEDSYLNLKGKRLDPLKTEELKLALKPTVQGTFSLKPTVLYLDENGKYKSHEPEPVIIIVKELGIKGWLKGER